MLLLLQCTSGSVHTHGGQSQLLSCTFNPNRQWRSGDRRSIFNHALPHAHVASAPFSYHCFQRRWFLRTCRSFFRVCNCGIKKTTRVGSPGNLCFGEPRSRKRNRHRFDEAAARAVCCIAHGNCPLAPALLLATATVAHDQRFPPFVNLSKASSLLSGCVCVCVRARARGGLYKENDRINTPS